MHIDPVFLRLAIVIIVSYLLGSIPVGLWIGKIFYHVDIRDYGSGRTGGTNVLRTCGKIPFVCSVAGDFLKSFGAVYLATVIMGDSVGMIGDIAVNVPTLKVMAGLAAVFGHIWPVFADFRGGRGVATFMGGLTALCIWAALFSLILLILIVTTTRFMSLGSVVAVIGSYVIMIPLTLLGHYPTEYMAYVLLGSILIVIAHSDNIIRLITGKERKVGQKAEKNN